MALVTVSYQLLHQALPSPDTTICFHLFIYLLCLQVLGALWPNAFLLPLTWLKHFFFPQQRFKNSGIHRTRLKLQLLRIFEQLLWTGKTHLHMLIKILDFSLLSYSPCVVLKVPHRCRLRRGSRETITVK